MPEPKYQNDFLGSLYETAEGLHKIGVITDTEMREYDKNCLLQRDKAASTSAAHRINPISPAYAGGHKQGASPLHCRST